jgi:hypothetical protein
VQETLNYHARFRCLDDPFNLWVRDPEQFQQLRQREEELEKIAKENMVTKNAIDNFRRIHTKKLTTLRDKLGIQATMQQFEAIIKAK